MTDIKVSIKSPINGDIILENTFSYLYTVIDIKNFISKKKCISIYRIKIFIGETLHDDNEMLFNLKNDNNTILFDVIFIDYIKYDEKIYNEMINIIYNNNIHDLEKYFKLPVNLNSIIKKNFDNTTLINLSCKNKFDISLLKLLISAKANVNQQECIKPPLNVSIKKLNIDKIKLLIENYANVNYSYKNKSPLFYSIKNDYNNNNYLPIIYYLLKNKSNPNNKEFLYVDKYRSKTENINSLMYSIIYNNFDLAIAILNSDITNVNVKSFPNNFTALIYAGMHKSNHKLVNELIKKNADINFKNNYDEDYKSFNRNYHEL